MKNLCYMKDSVTENVTNQDQDARVHCSSDLWPSANIPFMTAT